MGKPNITSDLAASCLAVLEAADAPLRAIAIARRLHLAGSRETQRRHVRAVVKLLRDKGCRIAASLHGGYFLAEEDDVWRAYLRSRQIDAKIVLGVTHKQNRMLTTASGQGLLFGRRRQLMTTGLG